VASLGLRQFDEAFADANKAIGINSKSGPAFAARGEAYRMTGKLKEALADFDTAIPLYPKPESAVFAARGEAYLGLGQFDKALVDFDQALALYPAQDTARAARGLTLVLKGNTAEGVVDIKTVLDRNPGHQIAQIGQGLAMLVSGQTDRALLALNQMIGKNTVYEHLARVLRARALLVKKDPAGALADLNVALDQRPNDPDALLLRSLVFFDKHETDKALDDLNKAIAQRETVENHFVRAKVYEAQSNFDKAAEDYRRATQLPAASVFDIKSQNEARQKVQQLSKKVPCGNSSSGGSGTCL
jgi:tetratricopeptide (TPR) repeat protein